MGKLRISMLGSSFTVNSPEDDEYLKKLLSYYQDITDAIKHSGNLLTPQQVSILAGITLVDELYKEKQRNANLLKQMENAESEGEEAESLANNLIEKLDKILLDDSHSDGGGAGAGLHSPSNSTPRFDFGSDFGSVHGKYCGLNSSTENDRHDNLG